MGYTLMKSLIANQAKNKKTKAQLTKMANVYFAAGQLKEEEYMEIMELINALEA